MDAIYFGTSMQWAHGAGAGPWILADMEDGMIPGGAAVITPTQPAFTVRHGDGEERRHGQLRAQSADATSPTLNTYWSGSLPSSKKPMKKQGSIVLGSGGDCC